MKIINVLDVLNNLSNHQKHHNKFVIILNGTPAVSRKQIHAYNIIIRLLHVDMFI